MTLEFLDFY